MMSGSLTRDALLQEAVGNKIRCHVCQRRCLIREGGFGWCRTRQNSGGRLATLIYGAVSSLSANPIEKKPFYHFHPGTFAWTVGSWSCNFGCPWCQNWEISKAQPASKGKRVTPERFVEAALYRGCEGTSISFNEPTLSLEWALEVFSLARHRGLYNTLVTNGYMTPEAMDLFLTAGLDAMNIDIKGDADAVRKHCKGIDVEKVWASAAWAHGRGIHLEMTTLVIPGVNDGDQTLRDIAMRAVGQLGADVPWHVTGYVPAYRFAAEPTPLATLERAHEQGKAAGLHFVYVGNHPGHPKDNTYCHACGSLLIERMGFDMSMNRLSDGQCPDCGTRIPGVWS
jgi:pyruvate formate lyase activating enzyme